MKFKTTAMILALTLASWAQTAPVNPPPAQGNAAPHAMTDCACCGKMASQNEEKSCCHHEMAGKDEKAMTCCAGEKTSCGGSKDAMPGMKSDKDMASTASCGDCCGKNHENGCCKSEKKGEKAAMNCGSDKHCGEHCASHTSPGAGN